jgi:nucleoside-diphosphate-sugar epimerase
MIALVTGAAGFIGSHLAESLLADGHEVVGIDCYTPAYSASRKQRNLTRAFDYDGFSLANLDLADGDDRQLADLLSSAEVVFHLAAEPGVRASWGDRFQTYARNNVLATQRLLEITRARGSSLARIVVASSSSIYGDALSLPTPEGISPRPRSPYGVTKLAAEQLSLAYHLNFGLPIVVLRYFSVYGPRQRPDMAFAKFISAALAGEAIRVYGDGRQTRDFTFVRDAVAATRAAAIHEVIGEVFNVGGGSQAALADVIELIGEMAGSRPEVSYEGEHPGDVRDTAADISRARDRLGFTPRVGLPEGIEEEYEWMASEVHGSDERVAR